MALTLVTKPTAPPVGVLELREHLRIVDAAEDQQLGRYLEAVLGEVDGPGGWFGQALLTQTWDWTLDGFPCGKDWTLYAPLPPLQSVTSIKYLDTAGVEQTLPALDYDVDAKSLPGRILPAYGKTWPSTRMVMNAVTVRLVAGYGNAAAVPSDIRNAIVDRVALLYLRRGEGVPAWSDARLDARRLMGAS